MDIALRMRRNSRISRGTHYRILAQARRNIKKSLFTVALAVRLGLVRVEDVQRLAAALSGMPDDAEPPRIAELMELARIIADRIVMS